MHTTPNDLLGFTDSNSEPVVVASDNSTVAFSGGSIGGDCSKCPLMKAAQKLISKSK